MPERQIDWRAFLNRLVYCYGCGRFGIPRNGQRPVGWNVLYQPYPQGPAGLNVCSSQCSDEVLAALRKGPVTWPLKMAGNVTMSAEMRQQMIQEAIQHAIDEGRMDDLFMDAIQGTEPNE